MRDTRNMRAGYGMKISWRDRDAPVSIGGMQDGFGIVNDFFENLTRWD